MTQNPAEKEQQARQLILIIQSLEEEIVRGQSNLQMLEIQSTRLAETARAVSELKNHAPGDEVLVNLGSGIHLQAKLVNSTNVITALGAGFAAEKTLDDALAMFEVQQKQLVEISKRQQEQLQAAQTRLEELRNQLAQLLRQ